MKRLRKDALLLAALALLAGVGDAHAQHGRVRRFAQSKPATAAPDTTPPTDGASLTLTAGHSQIALSWNAASDDVAVVDYIVKVRTDGTSPSAGCPTEAGSTTVITQAGTTYTDVGLTNGINRRYRVCARDAVPNVSTGLINNTTPANGRATDIDGTNEYCSIADNATLQGSNSVFTVCCSVRIGTCQSAEHIWGQWSTANTDNGIRLSTNVVSTQCRLRAAVAASATDAATNRVDTNGAALTDGSYGRVCVVYNGAAADGSELLIYVNASAQATTESGNIPDTRRDSALAFTIGAGANAASVLGQAYVDECRMWDLALSGAQITTEYNGGALISAASSGFGSVAFDLWMGDGDSHPNITDHSGNGNTCVLQNSESTDFVNTPLP